jgi:hypothetical protein
VPAAAGRDIGNITQSAVLQQTAQTPGVVVHDALQRFGGIQIKAKRGNRTVSPMNEDCRRTCRQRSSDPGRILRPRVLEAAANPPS